MKNIMINITSLCTRSGITKLGSPDAHTSFFKTLSMIIEASGSEASTSSGVANAAPPGNLEYDNDKV